VERKGDGLPARDTGGKGGGRPILISVEVHRGAEGTRQRKKRGAGGCCLVSGLPIEIVLKGIVITGGSYGILVGFGEEQKISETQQDLEEDETKTKLRLSSFGGFSEKLPSLQLAGKAALKI
jgi:hypothetical protein